jgi:hypothetical protein
MTVGAGGARALARGRARCLLDGFSVMNGAREGRRVGRRAHALRLVMNRAREGWRARGRGGGARVWARGRARFARGRARVGEGARALRVVCLMVRALEGWRALQIRTPALGGEKPSKRNYQAFVHNAMEPRITDLLCVMQWDRRGRKQASKQASQHAQQASKQASTRASKVTNKTRTTGTCVVLSYHAADDWRKAAILSEYGKP